MESDTIYRAWVRNLQQHRWDLWCETRDPMDPYLVPSPDVSAPVKFDRMTTYWTPKTDIEPWQPSADLLAKGHPSTWED